MMFLLLAAVCSPTATSPTPAAHVRFFGTINDKTTHQPVKATVLKDGAVIYRALNYNKVICQIQTVCTTYALRNAQVLAYTVYPQQSRQAEVLPAKQLTLKLDDQATTQAKKKSKPYIPRENHPWRRFRLGDQSKQPPTKPLG